MAQLYAGSSSGVRAGCHDFAFPPRARRRRGGVHRGHADDSGRAVLQVVRPSDGTGRDNASYVRRSEDIRPHLCAGGLAYNEGMKTSELQVLKAVVEIMCPWCHATARVTLGRGPHRCPACPAVISDLQLHIALASAISTAAA